MSAFDKVIGYEKEKEELYQLCDMAKNPEKYAALGVKLPRGILLYGVPGVGKTLMATALLDEMDNGRKRYVLRKDKAIEEFVESISKTFQEAKENAPSVIFLDDLDKFASDSDSRNPEELIAVQSGIQLTKQWIGENRTITLSVKADKTVINISAQELEEAEHDLLQAFEYMWFDFPTPFGKGDIVVSKYSPFGYNLFGNEPFVLTNLCSWGSQELKINGYSDKDGRYAYADRQLRYHRKNADETDMTAYGYFQWEDGRVYYECMHHYLDLEYYREEPQGIRRILKAFSSFEKEEIGSDLLAIAYHVILEEEKNKRERESLSCFTDEGLHLAGLMK